MRNLARPLEPAVLALVAVLATWAYLQTVAGQPIIGWDTYAEIESSRVRSLADLAGTFTEQTAEGYFPERFYRPVFNLLLALDYALFGLDPWGYQLTGALLTVACGLALFGLARRLLGSAGSIFGPFTVLGVFLLMPVHAEVLPLPSRYMDLLCLLFSALALFAQTRRMRAAWLPAVLTGLAVGSKESAVVLPPLVFLLVFLMCEERALLARTRRAVYSALPHLLVIAFVFAARFAAIGGLGGHRSTDLFAAITRLPLMLGLTGVRLSGLWSTSDGAPSDRALLYAAEVMMLLAFAVLALSHRVTRPAREGARETRSRELRHLACGAIGLAWWLGLAAVYGATGFVRSWHLLLPAGAAALVAGAIVEALAARLRMRGSTLATAGLTAALAVVIVWGGLQARGSPLFRTYTHWDRAGRATEEYLDRLAAQIEAAAPGDVLDVDAPPNRLEADPNQVGARTVTVLAVYSLEAWSTLRFPDVDVEFRHPTLKNAYSEPADDRLVIRVRGR